MLGRDAPYAEGPLFTPATEAADTDEAMITGSIADQTKKR